MSETTETFKTNASAPIPRPPTPVEEPVQDDTPLEIPEYNTSDFQEVHSDGPALSPEEEHEKRQIIRRLVSYSMKFPNELRVMKSLIADASDINDIDQLRLLLSDVERQISSSKSMEQAHKIFLTGVNVAEILSKKTPLKLEGLTQVCSQCTDLKDLVEELAIKYDREVILTPEQRFSLLMVSLIREVHLVNSAKEKEEYQPIAEEKKDDKKREELMEGL